MQTLGTDPIRLASFVGMGVGTYPRSEGLEILEVFAGTSAEAAGLRTGDLIVAIDGVAVESRRLHETISRMRGRSGSIVLIRAFEYELWVMTRIWVSSISSAVSLASECFALATSRPANRLMVDAISLACSMRRTTMRTPTDDRTC